MRNKLHSMLFKDGKEPQDLFNTIERILINLARQKHPVMENDKVVILLRSLPNSYVHIALLSEANTMDCDAICAMSSPNMTVGSIRKDMDTCKHRPRR